LSPSPLPCAKSAVAGSWFSLVRQTFLPVDVEKWHAEMLAPSNSTLTPLSYRLRHLFREPLRRSNMSKVVGDEGLNILFREARTHNVWLDRPVDDALLQRVYDLAKFGPTSANMCPMRVVFVRSKEAKEKLKPCLDAGNVGKTMAAPVTAIIGMD